MLFQPGSWRSYNLLGHALGVIARQQGRGLTEMAVAAGAGILGDERSLKAALDRDWDDPGARTAALGRVLAALTGVERWLDGQAAAPDGARAAVAVAEAVREQDVETLPEGVIRLRRGVAKERRISVEDAEMRHGRKSRSQRVDGYKRHVLAFRVYRTHA